MFGRLFTKARATPVVVPDVDPEHRVYAVGDIHGRHDLLDVIVDKIVTDHTSRDDGRALKVVFLGDYVDRGDHTREVLDRLTLMARRLPEETVFLSGNHEAALLGFLEDPVRGSDWLEFGGMQTLASYGVAPPKDRGDAGQLAAASDAFRSAVSDHLPFLRSLRSMYRSGDVVFVHAGIDPDKPLDRQSESAVFWGSGNSPTAPVIDGLRIVHGHFDNHEPIVGPQRVCVDTGAYYSGRLTAICLDAGERLIVADVMDL